LLSWLWPCLSLNASIHSIAFLTSLSANNAGMAIVQAWSRERGAGISYFNI
jgi:hypothetical protein